MSLLIPARIESRILTLRGVRVMIDSDLAELYGVPTKALNRLNAGLNWLAEPLMNAPIPQSPRSRFSVYAEDPMRPPRLDSGRGQAASSSLRPYWLC
ncbi:ORF6N domain-containing protein [Rhodoferax sp.]|uniref:ORF6N domain-containing protein n=1 Tax=Rhodoferax sp. TaxID=50421 RepID=UPI0025DE5C8C|nr:ORF6N domain-containing protein [Rhodoferax sp.]